MEFVPWLAMAISLVTLAFAVFDRVVTAGKDKQRLTAMEAIVGTQSAQLMMVRDQLSEFKIKAAETYITSHEIANVMTELYKRFDHLEKRLDSLIGWRKEV